MAQKTITIPKLTSYQKTVWDWLGDGYKSGKIAIIKSVRQSGKSFFCQMQLISMAFTHPNTTSVIFEPTLGLARNQFKQISKFFEGSNLIKVENASLLEITFCNGSTILFRSTEQKSRGFTATGILILDECAYLDDEEIYTILPLVNAYNCPIIIASTPFTTEGYFYTMYLKGLEGKEKVKTFDWAKEKEIERFLTKERKEFYKQTMSRAKYISECEGEFLGNEGLLFQNIDSCIGEKNNNAKLFYIGIDFASGNEGDYTVLSVMDEFGHQYEIHRTNSLKPMEQVNWLTEIILDLNGRGVIRKILAERNSIGAVYIDALRRNIPVQITEWATTNKSKQDLVTTLQIALENEQIQLLHNESLLNELRRYQAEINPKTKTITYNGKGANDDMVIATMLSYYAYKSNFGTYSISMKSKSKSFESIHIRRGID